MRQIRELFLVICIVLHCISMEKPKLDDKNGGKYKKVEKVVISLKM